MSKIREALLKRFKNHRIIFWYEAGIVEPRGVKSNYFVEDLIKMNRFLSLKYEGY